MARYRGLCISCSLDTALENAKLSSAPPSSAAASSALARVDATGATPPSSIRLVRSLLPVKVRGGVGWGARSKAALMQGMAPHYLLTSDWRCFIKPLPPCGGKSSLLCLCLDTRNQ